MGALPVEPLDRPYADLSAVFLRRLRTRCPTRFQVVSGEATPPVALSSPGQSGCPDRALVAGGQWIHQRLQQFIVITAVPVTFVLLPTAIAAPLALRHLSKQQPVSRDVSVEQAQT